MFVVDILEEFYNLLLGNRVLLLVHYDVDAVCACKILQDLFKCDNISYTLVPVGGISDLKIAYEENNEEIKYVVLLNCGGTVDLVDILQPEEDVVFFVLDSHKPTNVCNVYSDAQVRLLHKNSEGAIPNFDDIFRDDDNDDEDDNEAEGRREGLEALVERRRERRAWVEKRNTLMFNYTQFSYHGKPSTCMALELCWELSRVSTVSLWATAVALASHAALMLRLPADCLLDSDHLQKHVASGRGQRPDQDKHAAHVVLEKDVWLPMYRSWSVDSALRHSPALGPYLKLHTLAGAGRVRQLLADMGFPLQQAKQAYRSMDVELRHCLLTALETAAPKHKLPEPTRATFLLQRPHAPIVAALDLVFVIMALIENSTIPKAEGFQQALSALNTDSSYNESRQTGTAAAQTCLETLARVVNSTLQARKLHLAGPFTYFIVEVIPEASVVRGPLWLGVAARWAVAASGGTRPVVASAPLDDTTCLLLGVPPRCEQEPRNLFGAAFEQAATRSGASVSLDYFDSSVVTMPIAQRAQFLDALTALLA